ncbi:MAG: hypothetical protein L6Q76_32440, partial [Polyangiaceae bacterium]|nr:hypothetical protein [Polyangiaceae bacterium]
GFSGLWDLSLGIAHLDFGANRANAFSDLEAGHPGVLGRTNGKGLGGGEGGEGESQRGGDSVRAGVHAGLPR